MIKNINLDLTLCGFVGSFEAMDLNKDGQIHRDEFQTWALGFWCDIGEERFSHFFGALKN